ncbi:SRPBCC family protein [Thermococcus sp. SY098]|uniref:SRPBCC family protein n=1 Tax=Thermococcus sp. SY098 TaxID=3111325 RepID=UPI002D78C263|nr:SRPBCC family protein [Thermococcus sp. SY098]WRS53479.1 SRPBCC family protein [Thermococcus sp. SY098]
MNPKRYRQQEIRAILERLKKAQAEFLECKPPEDFLHCVRIAVLVDARVEEVFSLVSSIDNHYLFWPEYEFKSEGDGKLKKGLIYLTREKGAERWVKYRIVDFKENSFYSGEMMGKDAFLKKLRYEHHFIPVDDMTMSIESVYYSPRYGLVEKLLNLLIAERVIKKRLLNAHLKLKEVAEKKSSS